MKAHELAKILLDGPNLDVATNACGFFYASSETASLRSHGPLSVGILRYAGSEDHVVIGNLSKRDLQQTGNWWVREILYQGESWYEKYKKEK